MRIQAEFDLDQLGLTLDQWQTLMGPGGWSLIEDIPKEDYNLKDILSGWYRVCNVREAGTEATLRDYHEMTRPGTYALVFDWPSRRISDPFLQHRTILFGETTQQAYKRLATHTGALTGRVTNMSNKYQRHLKTINKQFDENVEYNLDRVSIWFRDHDPKWANNRQYSQQQERRAQAVYMARWGHHAPGNTRDLPCDHLVESAEYMLKNRQL